MVGGLDERYRVQADALVGAVQALVLDAEPGSGGGGQPAEIDCGVGWPPGHRAPPRGDAPVPAPPVAPPQFPVPAGSPNPVSPPPRADTNRRGGGTLRPPPRAGRATSRGGRPAGADEVNTGRQLGALIAKELVADINAMGMNAVQAGPGALPQGGAGVIRGYIVSAESGSMGKRFVIGFGSGSSEMDTVVEGFVMTKNGLRQIGSGKLGAEGNKAPGLVVPAAIAIATGNPIGLAVMGGVKIYGQASGRNTLEGRAKATADEIAAQLKVRFKERGWIS